VKSSFLSLIKEIKNKNSVVMATIPTSIKSLIDNWYNLLFNLSTKQLGTLTHLLAIISILLCLFTIITIIYSIHIIKLS
jgi:hypothetical protein